MNTTVERELKFEADSVLDLESLGGQPTETRVFTSVYHDTDDLRLLRGAVTLRRRMEKGGSLWQLRLEQRAGRLELEAAGGPAAPPPSLARVLSGVLRHHELQPVATLQVRRRGRRVDGVAVTLDEVEALVGRAVVQRFAEVEAELIDGSPEALERVGEKLQDLGARTTDGTPKLEHVVKAPEPSSRSSSRALESLRGALDDLYDELLRHDPAIRAAADSTSVHKMRVCVRRLRSVLRTAKPMLDPQWVEDLRDELDWLAKNLGEVRDLDVLIATLEADASELEGAEPGRAAELLEPLRADRTAARERLVASMEAERYYVLLDRLRAAAAAPPTRRGDLTVDELAAKEYRRLRKRVGELSPSMSNASLHKGRVRVKRARYAAELAEHSRGKKARRFIAAAKDLQDVLGEHQDAVVAIQRLRELALRAETRSAALAAARLIERQETRRTSARGHIRAGWRRLQRRGRRAWTD